jgi:hypothetical protein
LGLIKKKLKGQKEKQTKQNARKEGKMYFIFVYLFCKSKERERESILLLLFVKGPFCFLIS